MPPPPAAESSFSPRRRRNIILNVTLTTLVVLAVVVMVNFLGRDYFTRSYWGAQGKAELSPLTVNFLRSLTNQVKVTLFYNKKDPLYGIIAGLLDEYHLANPRISVQGVDWMLNPGLAQIVRAEYNLGVGAKDLILFDCPATGQRLPFDGQQLTKGVTNLVPVEPETETETVHGRIAFKLLRRPTEFLGERAFTSAILAVTSPKKLYAYFLEDHRGEHEIEDGSDLGYRTVKSILEQNSIHAESLSLLGDNTVVPTNCNLLVTAGPTQFLPLELLKIDQYLAQGGRLLALFNARQFDRSTGLVRPSGLEVLLEKWGVDVGYGVIVDTNNSAGDAGAVISVSGFSQTHPVVNPLISESLLMILPRKVGVLKTRIQSADAPHVEELAFTGAKSFTSDQPGRPQSYPVMVAVENSIRNLSTERSSTRILVVGDSLFLANEYLRGDEPARAFTGYAVNWLLDRFQLLQGIGPRPIGQYRIVMTKVQMQATRWLLLAGMPGTVLFLGALVWLRRRR